MAVRVSGLTRATIGSAAGVCQDCIWWQSRGNKTAGKADWMEKAESEWGEWGSVYLEDDGRVLGTMQYGPAALFPRGADLPAGPPSGDAVLVTCAYLSGGAAVFVLQSLLLAAIGEARDKGAPALEAFAYRYRESDSPYERFIVHRTVFPRDFLEDFGFRTLRRRERVELCRLELGGLQPVVEGARTNVLQIVRDAFASGPVLDRPPA